MNKQLKYLKIFEAFESIKLSKTLRFIKDKSDFLNLLTIIAKKIDLPLSKYSDEYFQYLPFNKALNLNFSYIDEPCEGTSEQSYPDFEVPGAKCEGGMVDRKWGNRVRKAQCNVCKGTGIKKRTDYPIKWFKFWFDKEGKYITTTGTDGRVRGQNHQMSDFGISTEFYPLSQNIDDYEILDDTLTLSDVRNLQTGTIIGIYIGYPIKFIIGTILRDSDERICIINNDPQADGGEPDEIDRTVWQSLGRYSWVVSSDHDMSDNAKLLKPKGVESGKTTDDFEDKVNPYTWNAQLNVKWGQISLTTYRDVQKLLSNAHFAIVLNYLDLTKSGFKTSSDIRYEREKSRKGSTYLMSDEEIKQLNINRYVEEIRKRTTLSDDLTDFSKILRRFMGSNYLGIYVLRGRNSSELNYLIDSFYKFMSLSEEDENKKYYYEKSIEYLKSIIEKNLNFNNDLTSSIKELRKMTHDNEKEHLEPIIDGILDLNKTINDKMGNFDIETLEDLEIFLEKYNTIRRVYKDSDRLRIRDTYYITEYLSNARRAFSNLVDIHDTENVLEKIRKFKIFVERL